MFTIKRKKVKTKRERFLSFFSGISGSLSFLGGWQICHNLCLGIVAALSLIGITIVGMPLLFLTQYAVYFWLVAVLLLIPTLLIYWKNRKYMSKNLILVNIGIIVASMPFASLQPYQVLFWSAGGILIGIAIFSHFKNKLPFSRLAMKIFVFATAIIFSFSSTPVLANGGPQKLVDDVLINLAHVPLSPMTGEKVAFLSTFVNATKVILEEDVTIVQDNRTIQAPPIIRDNASIKIWATDFSGGNKTFELPIKKIENDFVIFEFEYTFENPGLYELFFEFNLSSASGKTYVADFPLQVREKAEVATNVPVIAYTIVLVLLFAAFGLGWMLKSQKTEGIKR